MGNTFLTIDTITRAALVSLEHELVLAKLCNRDYEQEFAGPMKVGDTIRIRKPIKGQVRTGATMQTQDITEGRTTLTVASQIGADIEITSKDRMLSVQDLVKNVLRPQMIPIANTIDLALHVELYQNCPNWVGTPGQTVNSFADYALGPQRLDEMSIPSVDRAGILGPADYWGTLGSVSNLFISDKAKTALERAKLGLFAMTDTYMSQNVKAHTVGSWGTTPQVDGANQSTTWALSKDSGTMTLNVKGLTNSTGTIKKGDIFTLDGVFAVDAVTGDNLDFLRQFVSTSDYLATAGGLAAVVVSPALITSGPYKTASATALDSATITYKGTASTSYRQNLIFTPEAITLAIPPMIKPEGAVACSEQTYKGITARLIQGYDMKNDLSQWRFDMLYGVKAVRGSHAVRLSGTA